MQIISLIFLFLESGKFPMPAMPATQKTKAEKQKKEKKMAPKNPNV
jgi:hypothetical protein